MSNQSITVEIAGSDPDLILQATRQLRSQLLKCDGVDSVEPPEHISSANNVGAKGDALSIGALILAIAPEAVGGTFGLIKEWMVRKADETIRLKVQQGDRIVELAYDPRTTTVDEIESLVRAISPDD